MFAGFAELQMAAAFVQNIPPPGGGGGGGSGLGHSAPWIGIGIGIVHVAGERPGNEMPPPAGELREKTPDT